MSEEHQIVGSARGEPLPAGRVGVCVRFPLSGSPSSRWARDLSARFGPGADWSRGGRASAPQRSHPRSGDRPRRSGIGRSVAHRRCGRGSVDAANNDCANGNGVSPIKNVPLRPTPSRVAFARASGVMTLDTSSRCRERGDVWRPLAISNTTPDVRLGEMSARSIATNATYTHPRRPRTAFGAAA